MSTDNGKSQTNGAFLKTRKSNQNSSSSDDDDYFVTEEEPSVGGLDQNDAGGRFATALGLSKS